jgi:hypothetical protein
MCRELILRRVCLKCVDYCRQVTYHRSMVPYSSELKANYWIYSFNNFIDMAVLDWGHLYGNKNDNLHWQNVIEDKVEFKKELFSFLEVTEEQWREYWESIKYYRDKDVAHIEVRPSITVPDMDLGIKSVGFYYNWIIPELKEFGNYDLFIDNLFKYFDRVYNNTNVLVDEHLKELFGKWITTE